MSHVSYEDCLGYVDRALPPDLTRQVEIHLEGCQTCSAVHADILQATALLRSAGSSLRQKSGLDQMDESRGRDRVLARIRSLESGLAIESVACQDLTIARLRRLQQVVAPTCGAKTAFRLILTAVSHTPVTGDSGMLWPRFLVELRSLTSAFCGRSTAQLVFELGRRLK